jgi:hypothetical protein
VLQLNIGTLTKANNMTFKFQYQDVVRRPNPMVTINPLARGLGKVVDLQDRVNILSKSSAWNKMMKRWSDEGKKVDLSRMPKVGMFPLGNLEIDEDIQRVLDDKHCANKIANLDVFDPALLQTIQCILTSSGKLISIDGQHTSSTIAGLIAAGMVDGVNDWRSFEFPVQYIETDNLAFARRAFSLLNGKGKKPQSSYQQLRNAVFIVRIDKDTSDKEDVQLEKLVSIAEKNQCFPIEAFSGLNKYPGTFGNIATFKSCNEDEVELATKWHNTYFHYESLHVSTFFIFRDMNRAFKSAKLPITDKLLKELAGLVQTLFGDLGQYQESVTRAHRLWTTKRYGYQANWDDDAYACALLQLYKHFGGEERVAPNIIDRFDDIIDFFDEDILSLAA